MFFHKLIIIYNRQKKSKIKSIPVPPVLVMEDARVIALLNPFDRLAALLLSLGSAKEQDVNIQRNK